MPLPTPNKDKNGKIESKEAFINRCLADTNVRKDFNKSPKQAVGVCYSLWDQHQKKNKK